MRHFAFIFALIAGLLSPAPAPQAARVSFDPSRTFVLHGAVMPWTVNPVLDGIIQADTKNPNAPIYLVINSPGGSVVDGMRLAHAMDATAAPIVCFVDGGAYSMAAILTQWCDKTYMVGSSDLMFHEASFGMEGSESHIKSRVEHVLKWLDDLHKEICKRMGMPYEEYRAAIAKELWLTAEEATKAGLADGVIWGFKFKYPPVPGTPANFKRSNYLMMCGPTRNQADPCYVAR